MATARSNFNSATMALSYQLSPIKAKAASAANGLDLSRFDAVENHEWTRIDTNYGGPMPCAMVGRLTRFCLVSELDNRLAVYVELHINGSGNQPKPAP